MKKKTTKEIGTYPSAKEVWLDTSQSLTYHRVLLADIHVNTRNSCENTHVQVCTRDDADVSTAPHAPLPPTLPLPSAIPCPLSCASFIFLHYIVVRI